jgi:arylsulfatase A-like enzyme
MRDQPPNFLLICVDQMRADHLGCNGNPVIRTPHLDSLASTGVLLRRAYVNNPLCMPGRATMFTGLTPRGHRVRTNGISLDPTVPTVPGALANAGYQTASIGKIHLTTYGVRPDFAPDGLPPEEFPEQYRLWKAGQIARVPTPYFGFRHVEITIGHGPWVQGDYALWLQREHPREWERLQSTRPEPSPLGAEECGTYPLEERLHHTAYVADRAIAYLQRCQRDQPFFLVCSFPDPHHPYCPPRPWDRMYSPTDVVPAAQRAGELDLLPPHMRTAYEHGLETSGRGSPAKMSEEHRREILAHTYGMVSLIDDHVGRVLAALDELGLAEDTVVVFVSDHGDLMGDHGLHNKGPYHFDGVLRVPMIWRWPQRFPPSATSGLASLLDLAPTMLDLAAVPIPTGPASDEAPQEPPAWPGRSLAPLLRSECDAVQDSVVIENDEDYLGLRLRTLVTATHKITTYTGHRGSEPYGELFDLASDPHELHNLWDDPAAATLKQDLIVRLHHRLVQTDIALPRRIGHA